MTALPFYNQFNRATQKIQDAQALALRAHGPQQYGSNPYAKHLEDVVTCLEKFGFKADAANSALTEDIVCAGWLHDVVEDAQISLAEIEGQFGFNVSDIVRRVTDEAATTRAERKALTYPKIRGHFAAPVVKLADRIANVNACWTNNETQFFKYAQEQKSFHDAVFFPMIAEPMWAYLRFLLGQKFGERPKPLESVCFFFEQRPNIKIDVTATFEQENLRIEDYARGKSVQSAFSGD
jgi:hypothetical protein